MAIKNIEQPDSIIIDQTIRLTKPKEKDWIKAKPWYQNPKVLYFSEGIEDGKVYTMDTIKAMYKYLSNIGELYFIEVYEGDRWKAIGDVTLSEENMPIVIGDEAYWGKGIGKKVIEALINRGKEIRLSKIYIPSIYNYNIRSQNLFKSMGFVEVSKNHSEGFYVLKLK